MIFKKIKGVSIVDDSVLYFNNAAEAERFFYNTYRLKVDQSAIRKCCKGFRKSVGGYRWFYTS